MHKIDAPKGSEIHKVKGVSVSHDKIIPRYGTVHGKELELILLSPDDTLHDSSVDLLLPAICCVSQPL